MNVVHLNAEIPGLKLPKPKFDCIIRRLYNCEPNGNFSRAVRRNFHDESTADLGKGTNPPRTIKHRLPVSSEGGWGIFGSTLQCALVYRFDLPGSGEVREERRTTIEHVPK
ncbi:hypothetical protein AVEN_222037-1 [Araneus ventricosus]|uniref:Uncharacterized protein n=1 Tax=Araneus ventricosus TaxID=182803 RepID=A0A4Y2JTM7_ARAVE|nr:hypothetical protein AVEN_222037-1 [Araneus ventricosus]